MQRFWLKRPGLPLRMCVLALILLTAAQQVNAQTDRQVIFNSVATLETDAGVAINSYLTIIDSSGAIVTPQTISVLVDGQPVKVTDFGRPTTPLSVTLLLDASSDVTAVQPDVRKAVGQLFTSAAQDTQFSILRYGQKVDVLSPATADRTALTNALNTYYPTGPATCLSTAFSQALSTASTTSPTQRRVILAFTGGLDVTNNRQPCSPASWDAAIAATEKSLAPRIPIYIVAWQGTDPVDTTSLGTLAQQTGGYLIVGSKQSGGVGSALQHMYNIVQNQVIVSALALPTAGAHTIQLEAVFPDNTKVRSNTLTFVVQQNHVPTPTPTASLTPIAVGVTLQPLRVSGDFSTLTFDVQLSGAENVAEYHAIFKSGNQLLATYVLPAPLKTPVTLPVDKLGSGTFSLDLVAYGKNGQPIAGVYDQTFQINRPTATPLPPTNTPVVAAADIQNFQFDGKANLYHLTLNLTARTALNTLELDVFGADNALVDSQPAPVSANLTYNPQKLKSGTYSFVIVAFDTTGVRRASPPQNVTYTAPTVTLEIAPPSQDDKLQQWTIPLTVTNSQLIATYRVRIVNHDTGLAVVKDQTFSTPPYDALHIPLAGIPSAKYDVQIDALSSNDDVLTSAKVLLTYAAPAGAEPPSSSAPAASSPSAAGVSPLAILGGIVALVIVSLGALLISRRNRPRTIRGLRDLGNVSSPAEPDAPTHTKFIPLNQPPLPVAELLVKGSRNPARLGNVTAITQRTFTIGRTGCDLNFGTGDEGISAIHIEIWCDPKDNSFYVSNQSTTNPISVNGTLLNNKPRTKLPGANTPRVKLSSPSSIEFGTVQLIFKAGHIAGKTQPAAPSAIDGTQVIKRGSDLNAKP